MDKTYTLAATSRTPAIELDPQKEIFVLTGECYPEDASQFFDSLGQQLKAYFDVRTSLLAQIKLIYFNSSSARALMELMDEFESLAKVNKKIEVVWYCDKDDDVTQEFVEDLLADYSAIQIRIELED